MPNVQMKNRLGFTAHNFCAIADPRDSRPFCYTTDPNTRWEYCDCQLCNRTQSGSQCLPWDASSYAHNFCKLESDGSSYCLSSKPGVDKEKCHPHCLDISHQSGIQSKCDRTQSGRTCQRWDRNQPHVPNIQPIVNAHNFCSKPYGDNQHWCYTTDPNVRWEYCHPKCEVMTTTTTTTTVTTPTPRPNHSRTLHGGLTSQPGDQNTQCGKRNSNKFKKKMSYYSPKGFCWCPKGICSWTQKVRCSESSIPSASNSNNGGSARSMSPTGWMNGLQDKIYNADAQADSFDFPWFVRVGTGYLQHKNILPYPYY